MKIKFVDLNIWLGGKIWDPMISFLKKESADILTLQEVHNSTDINLPRNFRSLELIQRELGYKYYYFDPCFIKKLDGLKTENGNAIFSRYPIIAKESFELGGDWGEYDEADANFELLPRKIQFAEIAIGDIRVNIFNTQGVWGTDGRDNPERLKMGKTISELVKDKKNVILAGDFNVNPDTKTIAMIEKNLKNIFKNEVKSSFNMKWKTSPGYATAVVDMIFVSPNIKTVEHYCPRVDVSDHLPLVCVLEV